MKKIEKSSKKSKPKSKRLSIIDSRLIASDEEISRPDGDPVLFINNFDNTGKLYKPPVPCNAVCIDPQYINDTNTRQRLRPFLMKSDVHKLREVTRTKFFLYTNQELALKEQQKIQYNQKIYDEIMEFYNFCFEQLSEMERNAFNDMQEKYSALHILQSDSKLQVEKFKLEMVHQKLYTRIYSVYQRFRYLLKLIEYFDHVSDTCDDVAKFNRMINQPEIATFLDAIPMKRGPNETKRITELLNQLIRPYLDQKSYMDVVVWERSYQAIRRKIAHYNQHLTRVALINHFTEMIRDKFMKVHNRRLIPKPFEKDTNFMKERTEYLRGITANLLSSIEQTEKRCTIRPLLEGIVPVMVRKLGLDTKSIDIPQKEDHSIVDKLEKIQQRLMHILYELDTQPPGLRRQIERTVRQQVIAKQVESKVALVQQTRFQNLLQHYRSHYAKKK